VETDRLGDNKGVTVHVILDTSFLMGMAKGLYSPHMIGEVLIARYKLIAPEAVKRELDGLKSRLKGRVQGRIASRALELCELMGVEFIPTSERDADDSIEGMARRLKSGGSPVVVASNDRGLRRRLRRIGVPSIYYRESEGRLEIEWDPL